MSESITCPFCHRVSHHPMDVKEKYCAACHVFHGDGVIESSEMPQIFFDPIALETLLCRLHAELEIHKTQLAMLVEICQRHNLREDFTDANAIIHRLESKIAQVEKQVHDRELADLTAGTRQRKNVRTSGTAPVGRKVLPT